MLKNFLLIGLLSIFLASPALAADETYQAEIAVDVSADNATLAKQNAMSIANAKGLITVVKRIAPDSETKIFEALTPEQVANFIKEVDVIDENATNTRYMARFNIKINETLLKTYMQDKNLTIIQDTPRDVLIIPIMRRAPNTEALLFADDNLWLTAWNNKKIQDGTITFYTIKPDYTLDVHAILASNALTIETIIKENAINDIYILEATPNNNSLTITLTSHTTGIKDHFDIDMSNTNYFDEAITGSVSRIADLVKKQRLNQIQSSNQITVLYHYSSLKDWVSVEQALNNSNYIRSLNVDAFGNGKVQFKVEYTGTLDDVQKHLQRSNLQLEERQENVYILKKI